MKKRQPRKQLAFLVLLSVLMGCTSEEERQAYKQSHNNAQKSVAAWIKKHALYPDSYASISFSQFSQSYSSRKGEKIPNSEHYVIKHTHQLLDKDSSLKTFSGYFMLEHDFDVNSIEIERSRSMGGAFPPQTKVWTDLFGRPMNAQDSLELEQKQQEVMDKFVNELKDGLENGDLKTEDPADMDKLKNLIDTLEKHK